MATPYYFSKWATFSATVLLMLSSGLSYTFSMWGKAIQDQYGYSVGQLGGLATACSVGSYLNVFPGLFYDSVKKHDRMGPKLALSIGLVLQFGGFMGLWLAATKVFVAPYWLMCLLGLLACNCGPWFETACMVTSVRNFEAHRGLVVSISKACLGLSAALFTTLYQATYFPDALGFLLLLAIVPAVCALLCLPFINYVPWIQYETKDATFGFGIAYSAIGALIAFNMLNNLTASHVVESEYTWLRLPALLLLMLPVLCIPWVYGGLRSNKESVESSVSAPSRNDTMSIGAPETPLLHAMSNEDVEGNGSQGLHRPLLAKLEEELRVVSPELKERNKTPRECLISSQFWIIFVIHFLVSGTGFIITNNLGLIISSLDAPPGDQGLCLSMYSAANAVGRASAGLRRSNAHRIIPEIMTKYFKTPRAAGFVMVTGILVASTSAMTRADLLTVRYIMATAGFACGASMGLTPAVATDCLGVKNFASNYAMLQLGPVCSSYVLAQLLFGYLYTAASGGSTSCHGSHCFSTAFSVMSFLSTIGLVFALLLWWKTVRLYKKLQAKDELMLQRESMKVHGRIQQHLLSSLGSDIARMDELLTKITARVEDVGDSVTRLSPEDGRNSCLSELDAVQMGIGEVRSTVRRLRLLQSRYQDTGLEALLAEEFRWTGRRSGREPAGSDQLAH